MSNTPVKSQISDLKSNAPSSLPSVKSSLPTPTLLNGHDALAAKNLATLFREAQRGMRSVVAAGLAAWEIKQDLKHGQFGPWLAANLPGLARPDEVTGKPKASSALTTYMSITKDVLGDMGYTIKKYFAHVKFPALSGICRGGNYLLLPDAQAAKLPKEAVALRDGICTRVDGKTAKQIRLEFGHVDDDEGTVKPKRGTPSKKGNPKEQREAAALRKEQEQRAEDELRAVETAAWLKEISDDSRSGHPQFDPKALRELFKGIETFTGYHRNRKP